MPLDHGELRAEDDPDVPWDDEDEDEIMAELRLIREKMLAEFPTDEALFVAIKAQEAELITQGKIVVSPPAHPQLRPKPDAA